MGKGTFGRWSHRQTEEGRQHAAHLARVVKPTSSSPSWISSHRDSIGSSNATSVVAVVVVVVIVERVVTVEVRRWGGACDEESTSREEIALCCTLSRTTLTPVHPLTAPAVV